MKIFLPREHGLLGWVGLPLVAALGLAPGGTTLLALASVLGGFCAFNARRRGLNRPALLALGAGALAAAGALSGSSAPLLLGAALGTGALAGLAGSALPQTLPRQTALEVGAILGLVGLGGALALGGGADPRRVATVFLMLGAWQLAGLWWIRRSLAGVLPRRSPWQAGLGLALAVAAAAVAAGCWYGLLTVPAALLLYPLRMAVHPPPASPRDAKRVGMTELVWSLVAVAVAVLGSGGG